MKHNIYRENKNGFAKKKSVNKLIFGSIFYGKNSLYSLSRERGREKEKERINSNKEN